MQTKIASSGSLEGLEKLINQFFYSSTYKIDENLKVFYSKGENKNVLIKKIKGRFIAYLSSKGV